jgi:transposase-like protein
MVRKLILKGGEVREQAMSAGITIEDLARALDMNSQTFYRKKDGDAFSPKTSRKLFEFFEQLTAKAVS